jgi:large subunit ribosomal protein L18
VRPRMAVCFTNENIHVQFIDDDAGVTLAAASTVGKTVPKETAANVAGAKTIGSLAAKQALDKGIKEVVFDRGGMRYHGKVKALADAAREAGLKF